MPWPPFNTPPTPPPAPTPPTPIPTPPFHLFPLCPRKAARGRRHKRSAQWPTCPRGLGVRAQRTLFRTGQRALHLLCQLLPRLPPPARRRRCCSLPATSGSAPTPAGSSRESARMRSAFRLALRMAGGQRDAIVSSATHAGSVPIVHRVWPPGEPVCHSPPPTRPSWRCM